MTEPHVKDNGTITEDEAALYDRQIRLWGLDSQEKIRHAAILIVGYTALANETCKNLVLAGVGRIVLADDALVQAEDLSAQFYFTDADIGQPRVEVAKRALERLNPRVQIETHIDALATLTAEQVDDFQVVCWSGSTPPTLESIVNTKQVKLFSAQCYGPFGYIFCDARQHNYIEEREMSGQNAGDTKVEKHASTVSYPSLADTTGAQWPGITPKQLRRKVAPLYFALRTLWAYVERHGRLPIAGQADDLTELRALRREQTAQMQVDETALPDELLHRLADTARVEFTPVCAILGGILAQDVLKVVSGKDRPINNFFFYNGLDCSGLINRIEAPNTATTAQ